jgi:hypothetical protein
MRLNNIIMHRNKHVALSDIPTTAQVWNARATALSRARSNSVGLGEDEPGVAFLKAGGESCSTIPYQRRNV